MSSHARLFLAIPLPGTLAQDLQAACLSLREGSANVRWVAPESMHITLQFLGDVDTDRIGELEEALARVRGPVLDLQLRGLGTFPPGAQPRVVWAGVDGHVDGLRELVGAIGSALEPLGFQGEDRPFRPHVTLGRVRGVEHPSALRRAIERVGPDVDLQLPTTRSFSMFQSENGSTGPRYRALRTFEFTG